MSNLRPMQLGEILDATFSIYRRHFALFMRMSLVVVWLPSALWVYFQVRYGGTRAPELFEAFEQHTGRAILILVVLLLISGAASLLLKAGTIQVISESYLGHEPKLAPALQLGAAKIWPLLVLLFAKGIIFTIIYIFGALALTAVFMVGRLGGAAVSLLLLLVGGVGICWFMAFVGCGYGLTTPAVVLERLSSSFDAFSRSWDLTRGFKLKTFGVWFVTLLIAEVVPQIVVLTLGFVILGAAPALQPFLVIVTSLLGILLAPIMPCALTLLYYDLRVRREAFDLQMLSQELGIS
jgi:hypothetical protein